MPASEAIEDSRLSILTKSMIRHQDLFVDRLQSIVTASKFEFFNFTWALNISEMGKVIMPSGSCWGCLPLYLVKINNYTSRPVHRGAYYRPQSIIRASRYKLKVWIFQKKTENGKSFSPNPEAVEASGHSILWKSIITHQYQFVEGYIIDLNES